MKSFERKAADPVTFTEIITFLRYPLSVVVIMLHCNLSSTILREGKELSEDVIAVMSFFPMVIGTVCVPMFFIFSGYLFFYKKDGSQWKFYQKQWLKRLKSILLPYILWQFFALVIYLVTKQSANPHSTSDLLRSFIFFSDKYFPLNYPLWYLRDLLLWILLSPLIFRILRLPGWIPAGLLIPFILVAAVCLPVKVELIIGFLFFSIGAWWAIHKVEPCKIILSCSRRKIITVGLITLFGVLYWVSEINPWECASLWSVCKKLTGCVALLFIITQLLSKYKLKIPAILTASSFFIYCFHGPIVWKVKILIARYLPAHNTAEWLTAYFILLIVMPLFCTGVYMVSAKFFPKLTNILSGGRG